MNIDWSQGFDNKGLGESITNSYYQGQDRAREEVKRKALLDAGALASGGDFAGAQAAALGAGDLTSATSFATLNKSAQEANNTTRGYLNGAAYAMSKERDPVKRRVLWLATKDSLVRDHGAKQEDLDTIDQHLDDDDFLSQLPQVATTYADQLEAEQKAAKLEQERLKDEEANRRWQATYEQTDRRDAQKASQPVYQKMTTRDAEGNETEQIVALPRYGASAPRSPVNPTGSPQASDRSGGYMPGSELAEMFKQANPAVRINGTDRTPQRNREVNGVPNSQHIARNGHPGTAVDMGNITIAQAKAILASRGLTGEVIQHDAGSGLHVHVESVRPVKQTSNTPGRGTAALAGGGVTGANVVATATRAKKTGGSGGAIRSMSPEEVRAANLPEGTVAQISANGKISVLSKPSAGDKETEFMGKSRTYAGRMAQAEAVFDGLAKSGYNRATNAAGIGSALDSIPIIGGNLQGMLAPQTRSQEQAERNWLTANLRQESGATIGPSEFEMAARQYFPRAGDDLVPGLTAQKKANRAEAQRQMALSASGGKTTPTARPTAQPTAKPLVKVSSPAQAAALPSGTRFQTPDGRILIKH